MIGKVGERVVLPFDLRVWECKPVRRAVTDLFLFFCSFVICVRPVFYTDMLSWVFETRGDS